MLGVDIRENMQFEMKKEIVNNAVRICLECGSLAVKIDNYGIFCKDCNSQFPIEHQELKRRDVDASAV